MQTSILQALSLMNGPVTAEATHLERSETLAALLDAPFMDTLERIETLDLAALSRTPTPKELSRMLKYVEGGGSAGDTTSADKEKAYNQALADVFWVLLNSGEFFLNHSTSTPGGAPLPGNNRNYPWEISHIAFIVSVAPRMADAVGGGRYRLLDVRLAGKPRRRGRLQSAAQARVYPAVDGRFAQQLRQRYLAQFRMADKDNNGYLDRNEANQNPLYRNLFAMMDRDSDGKLFEKEVSAYLERMRELQEIAMRSCASLAVKDQGRGLFDMVDTSNDGRLGIREMRQMARLVDALDRDGDGRISRGEIPHKFRVDVRRGPATGNQFAPAVAVLRRIGTNEPPLPERTAGPLWFRKMDRNHDGDVSRREFLGTDAEFRKIDTDGDGLISTEEAKRADRLLRPSRPERSPR